MFEVLKKTAVGFIVALLMVPAGLMLEPQPAHAVDIDDIGGSALEFIATSAACLVGTGLALEMSAITAFLTVPTNDNLHNFVRCVIKPAFYFVAQLVIDELVNATVAWIEGGFEGGPAFLTDPAGFMTDIGDRIATEFLVGVGFAAGIGNICEEFQLDIQLSLILEYFQPDADKYNCTLEDIVDNIQNFVDDGIFAAGNWEGWMHLSAEPQNNPIGSWMEAKTEMYVRIMNAQGEEIWKTPDGFRSAKDAIGNIVTPGKYVLETAVDYTGAPLDRIIQADDIDEIVAAILGAIINSIIGDDGLLGAGASIGGGGAQAAFEAARQELLAEIDAAIVQAQGLNNLAIVDLLNQLRAQVVAIDAASPTRFTLLQQARQQLASILAQLASGAGGGPGGGGPTTPPGTPPGTPGASSGAGGTTSGGPTAPPPPPPPPGGGSTTSTGGGGAPPGAPTAPPAAPPGTPGLGPGGQTPVGSSGGGTTSSTTGGGSTTSSTGGGTSSGIAPPPPPPPPAL